MARKKIPSFVLELPLVVHGQQAKRLHAHLEAARCLYNALLGEALKRMQRMRSDPAWQTACGIPRSRKQERTAAFSDLRQKHGFSEYGMHDYAKVARCSWIADHIDSTFPSIDQTIWEGAETRLSAAVEELIQRASAGQKLPRCVGIPGDRARLHESLANPHLELVYRRGRLEAVG